VSFSKTFLPIRQERVTHPLSLWGHHQILTECLSRPSKGIDRRGWGTPNFLGRSSKFTAIIIV
jgi:hypothetical protein